MNRLSSGRWLPNDYFNGKMGVEIEEQRTDLNTRTLSRTPHPSALGDRRTQPYFQTDFSESMEEVVTSPKRTPQLVINGLHRLQGILYEKLTANEIIWPLSMPPKLQINDEEFLRATFKRPWYEEYREKLIKDYGLFQHIICGVHFSYSPSAELVKRFAREKKIDNLADAKNSLLITIAQQIVTYRYLITYFFGATPVSENKRDNIPSEIKQRGPVRSLRSSDYGFANHDDISVSYQNARDYYQDIKKYLDNGTLYDSSEFYGPARLKANQFDNLLTSGADYLEIRVLDNNPFAPDGVSVDELNFIWLLILDVIVNSINCQASQLAKSKEQNNRIALQSPSDSLPDSLRKKAKALFARLRSLIFKVKDTSISTSLRQTLDNLEPALDNPQLTISAKLLPYLKHDSLAAFAVKQGRKWKQEFHNQTNEERFIDIRTDDIVRFKDLCTFGEKINYDEEGNIIV